MNSVSTILFRLFINKYYRLFIMSKVFRISPKRIKRVNGTVLTPEMEVTVSTTVPTSNPFYNGAKEIIAQSALLYGFDYKKACCTANDFTYKALD